MIKDIKLSNPKSVTFRVKNFSVPIKKTNKAKHTINAEMNEGFFSSEKRLSNGYGVSRLSIATSSGNSYLLRSADGTAVKRIFCFSSKQMGSNVGTILIVTETGCYYAPMFGSVPVLPVSLGFTNFDCFAHSYSFGEDYVFASNEQGVFVANSGLLFDKILDVHAKQLVVFGHRLFILAESGEEIHFSQSLNLRSIDGCIKPSAEMGKVIGLDVYENKLLVVHEYGFSTIETAFDSAKFRLRPFVRSYSEIVSGSARVLGDTIFFLTRGGLCRAVRGKTEQIDSDLSGSDVKSYVYDNKYFLSTGDKLVVIDKFHESVTSYNVSVSGFERVWNDYCDRLAILVGGNDMVFQVDKGGSGTMVWESDYFNLTYAATSQRVRQLLVKTAGDIEVAVLNNSAERKFKLSGSESVQRINLNFKGEIFKIRIYSDQPLTAVESLSVVVGFN